MSEQLSILTSTIETIWNGAFTVIDNLESVFLHERSSRQANESDGSHRGRDRWCSGRGYWCRWSSVGVRTGRPGMVRTTRCSPSESHPEDRGNRPANMSHLSLVRPFRFQPFRSGELCRRPGSSGRRNHRFTLQVVISIFKTDFLQLVISQNLVEVYNLFWIWHWISV